MNLCLLVTALYQGDTFARNMKAFMGDVNRTILN